MPKVIVAGGRDFKDYKLIKRKLDYYLQNLIDIVIVSGKQETKDPDGGESWGTDFLGEKYAKEKGYPVDPYPADWKRLGKRAGPIRNEQMAKDSGASFLIAFWDGKSRGTKNMINNARKYGLKIKIVKYE